MSTPKSKTALLAFIVLLSAVLVVGVAIVAQDGGTERGADATLTADWVSDTGRNITGNHHVAVGGTVDGRPLVFAPISGEAHERGNHDHRGGSDDGHTHAHDPGASSGCGLVALNGTTGGVRWIHEVPAANCTIHSVADPTLADVDGDGVREVLATSTERTVAAFDPDTGDAVFRRNLSAYGYTRPVVADLTGDDRREVIVVDVHGAVFVFRPNGTTAWTRTLPDAYVWGQPHVGDFDGDGNAELAVAVGNGRLYLLDGDGSIAWTRSVGTGGSVTWFATGQADDDRSAELVTATDHGAVSVFDGEDGSVVWREDLGRYAAVRAVGDGDGDGTPEVYATARDGALRALAAPSGEVEWTTTLTTEDVQMMPPPVLGDVDADGDPELVAASNDGSVAVVDPASGEILATYDRETPVWTNPTLADVDADSALEILVMFGDGRVAALSYEAGA